MTDDETTEDHRGIKRLKTTTPSDSLTHRDRVCLTNSVAYNGSADGKTERKGLSLFFAIYFEKDTARVCWFGLHNMLEHAEYA
jgi:hypothetical protein